LFDTRVQAVGWCSTSWLWITALSSAASLSGGTFDIGEAGGLWVGGPACIEGNGAVVLLAIVNLVTRKRVRWRRPRNTRRNEDHLQAIQRAWQHRRWPSAESLVLCEALTPVRRGLFLARDSRLVAISDTRNQTNVASAGSEGRQTVVQRTLIYSGCAAPGRRFLRHGLGLISGMREGAARISIAPRTLPGTLPRTSTSRHPTI